MNPWRTFRRKLIDDGFEEKPIALNLWADLYAGTRDPALRDRVIRGFGLQAIAIARALTREREHQRADAQSEALVKLILCVEEWPNRCEEEGNFRRYAATSIRLHVQDWLKDDAVFRRPARREREKEAEAMLRHSLGDDDDGGYEPAVNPPEIAVELPLSPRSQRIFDLHLAGYTPGEIAEVVGRSEKAIRRDLKEILSFLSEHSRIRLLVG